MKRRAAIRAVLLILVPLALVGQIWALPALFGQSEIDPVQGLEIDAELLSQEWTDPIEQFELADEPLAAVPAFDFTSLHESPVFESGLENFGVSDAIDLSTETEHHLRALQAVATGELALSTVNQSIADNETAIDRAANVIADTRSQIDSIEDDIAAAEREIDQIISADDAEIAEQARLRGEITEINGAIVELAIQAFTGEDEALETILTEPESLAVVERRILTAEVREFQRDDIEALLALIRESEQRREDLAAELAPVEAANAERRADIEVLEGEIVLQNDTRSSLRTEIAAFEARGREIETIIEGTLEFTEVTAAQYQVAYHQRLSAFVTGTDIPLVALNAYVRATRTLATEDPGCGIHWSQLAGIGRIESIHGYFGNSTLDANGHTTEDIRGLRLDGRNLAGGGSLAVIRDSDNGALDGDTVYDRAVGPMQFIPTTWDLYGSDGDGDGLTDPQNIYDAALGSARLLCDAPGSMLTTTGEQRAYFAYNQDLVYSANVTRVGRLYHRQLDVAPESQAFAVFAELPTPEQLAAQAEAEAAAEAAAALAAEEAGLDADAAENSVPGAIAATEPGAETDVSNNE